jgi:iron(III) transport system substrate-binding protein
MIVNQALRPIADKFGKKYPFIKMTYWRADSEDIAQKASAEVRAGNVVCDVLEGTGVGEQAVQAGLLVPYATPAIASFPERYRDPGNMWTPTRLSYYSIAYNTRQVPEAWPRSNDDLLDPQWKGKIAWRIGSASGTRCSSPTCGSPGARKARAYFEEAQGAEDRQFRRRSARTLVDRVVAGEYAIALNIFAHHPLISKAKGAPVNSKLLDPVASTAATMGVVKGAHRTRRCCSSTIFCRGKGRRVCSAPTISRLIRRCRRRRCWRRWCRSLSACRRISSAPTC